ncbi:1 like protein [Verticillium longisporum]|uniref:1,3-beta-glucanosyltransferase n=1 Tax=Verticillium longisporum TaxID=100787 RepID=A0A8I2ZWF7_VERLO|nr:1 like protein [Verticillium longisporum]RBQ96276.1 hypothetical protein VDGD_07192 [Verticillium dahliae]
MGKFSTAAVSALLLASKVAALDPIVTKGSKFFYENGTQFFIKGIAYQEDPSGLGGENEDGKYIDPLADDAKCKRDVPILSAAGTNTIRVYAIDPKKDHSKCMTLLQDAGIYVVADLGEPNTSINRDDPHWDVAVWDRYTAVIDELAQYDNTIGFFAGNEVSNNGSNTDASAFVKAAVRDTKAYIKSKNYRWMGVGYAANDDPDIRGPSAHYFNCGPEDEAIDFWGYNIYSWCGESSMQKSGYDKQVEFFSNYSVPVFLAEYGCNVPDGAEGRLFQDTTALYSDDMSGVFSGGIVYMYHQEDNDYGLVKFKGDSKAEVMKNYKVLSSRVNAATASSTASANYEPTNSPAACPDLGENWQVSANGLPPTPDQELCECMFNSLSCKVKSSVSVKEYGEIFGNICGNNPQVCAGISTNATTGIYGAYSMCNATQKLGFVMNQYYEAQNRASSACNFDGNAERVSSPSAASSCNSKLSAASSVNAVAATATAASARGTNGGSSNADDNASFGLTNRRMEQAFSVGNYAVGLYVVLAAAVGGAMVVL